MLVCYKVYIMYIKVFKKLLAKVIYYIDLFLDMMLTSFLMQTTNHYRGSVLISYNIYCIFIIQDFVTSIWHQLLYQLLVFVSNLDFKQHSHLSLFQFMSLWYLTFLHISRYIHHIVFIVSCVHILKCTIPALLNNLIKTKHDTGTFRWFSTDMWQNAHINTIRHATMCDLYFSFSKILQFYSRDCVHIT